MRKLLLSICGGLLITAGSALGQGYEWSYHSNAGNPGGVLTESDAAGITSWNVILEGPTSSNSWSSVVEIPFTFRFFNQEVTHFKASANGIVTFDTNAGTPTDTNLLLPSDSLPSQSIACFWDEFTASAPTGTNDDIIYQVFGTAPNRQLWIKWYSFEMGDPSLSFVYNAAVLEETTEKIYIVDKYSTTTNISTMDATVGLQNSTTESVQAGGGYVDVQGNGSSNTDNDYYEFVYLDSLDARLVQITEPSGSLCPGTYPVAIEVQNTGNTVVDSLTLSVVINGGTPVNFGFGGLNLDTLQYDTLSLGSQTFSSGTLYDFEFYITSVNQVTDDDQFNDTLVYEDVQTGLTGTYTIDPTTATGGTNFQSFADVTTVLNNFGVCGSVIIEVDTGTYNDSVYLSDVPGSSATNSITFIGMGAGPEETVISYDGAGVEAAWQMDGTDHLIVKNLTIQNTKSGSDAWAVHLSNGADSNEFDSCRFIVPISTNFDVQCVVASSSLTAETGTGNNANYLTITNSYFEGGETGIHIEGDGEGNPTMGYTFTDNIFRDHEDEAIEVDDVQDLTFSNNDIDLSAYTLAEGIRLFDPWDFHIDANTVHVGDWGIYILDANDAFTPSGTSTINNNMIISDSDYGIYLIDFESTVILHNSVIGSPAIRINDQLDMVVKNNIFIGEGGFAFESDDDFTSTDAVDYNIYDSDATNMFDIGLSTFVDLSAWQTAQTSYNTNSLEGTPLFAGPTDLHVLDTLANDAGDNAVGVTVDIDGDSRPAASIVDIGADEYTPVSNDISPIAILSPSGTLCADSLQFIEVVVQNAGVQEQDTIPFVIQMIGTGTVTWQDTIFSTMAGFSIDTFTLGPISTFGLGNAQLNIISVLPNDENNFNDTISDSLFIIALPDPVTVMNDTICSVGDTGTLVASGSLNTIRWYEEDTSSVSFYEGDTLVSPVTGGVTYWVAQVSLNDTLVGAPSDSIGSSANFSSVTAQYMLFEATSPFTLDSLTVYPNGSGNVEVLLQDLGGSTLQSTTVAVSPASANAPVRIAIGFEVGPGEYRLAAGSNTTTGGLTRNSNGASYPYEVSGIMSITGNSFGSSYYYYFYNWRISYDGCESERTAVSVVYDSTTVELPADITICTSDEEEIGPLELGYTYVSYLWQNGSTDSSIVAGTAGTYTVTVTSPAGCERSDEMVISNFPEPQPNIGPDTTVCEGDDFTKTWDAGSGFVGYFWSNAGQTQSITINYVGTFTVTVTDNNGCEGYDTASVIESPLPVADAGPDVTICEDSIYILPQPGAGLTAVWTDGSGNVVTTANMAGPYYIEVTDGIGCSAMDTMEVSTIDCDTATGITQLMGSSFSVFPNPTRDLVFIEFERPMEQVGIELYDGLGKLVMREQMTGTNRKEIDLGALAPGYYLLKLTSAEDQTLMRLIVQ